MKAIVAHIGLFFHCFDGWKPCPQCGNKNPRLISTTNKYNNYCPDCDIRYTTEGEVYDRTSPISLR